jgi:formylglycine-generating enzyme required for sulfatase activity
VGHIYDRLKTRFGADAIFMDVNDIPPGYVFATYIHHVLQQCRVALVIIGPSWPTIVETRDNPYKGQPRLNNPADNVRIETEQALSLAAANETGAPIGDLRLIPLLVQGAHMPGAEQLPESLRPLTRFNSATVRHYPTFDEDIEQLIGAIAQWIGGTAPSATRPASPSSANALPALGPAPAPANSVPVLHLKPMPLYNLGFRGYSIGGVECILPPICPVPAGVFTMGSDKARDKQAKDDETLQYLVEVGDFAMGQHPVTRAEYACAVRAYAVREPQTMEFGNYKVAWQDQQKHPDFPLVFVSWGEARFYCAWLARLTGQPWRLPSEAEWEKAARGADGRIYPWGDTFGETLCNTSWRGVQMHTPVGHYPKGKSPYGVQDMVGNVWEWTSSLYRPYPYRNNDGREDFDSTNNRVLRGAQINGDVRVARRLGIRPDYPMYYGIGAGFRLAWTPTGS